MSLDKLTDDLILTLNKFNELKMNTEAREYWTAQYQDARQYYGTKQVHCIDCKSYEVANRKLEQYYETVVRRGIENGQLYLELSRC